MNRHLLLILLLVAGLTSRLCAANAPAAPANSAPVTALDPKVRDILTASATFYAAQKSIEGDISSTVNIGMNGLKQEMDSTFHLALQRPNSFALVLESGMMGGTMVCDGKTSTAYLPVLHKYTSSQAPDDLSDLLQPMNLIMVEGSPLPMGFDMLLRKDPTRDAGFPGKLTASRDMGVEKVGETPAHHIELVNLPYTTDLWIAEGTPPVLLQARSVMDISGSLKHLSAEQKKKLPPGTDSMTMNRETTYSNWKFNQPVAANAFTFHPPADAKLASAFFPQPPHPLVGKIAPDFKLTDLKGRQVSLASLRGKVVVLDFWATWCGPCVAALPVISKVTSSFKDKGVVFYAVNLREKADVIRKFQSDKNLIFPALLDTDGKVASLYRAKGIPQSVVIDKNGKIQAVHVGYSSDLKQTLTQQLTDVIHGKQLATTATP